MGALVTRNPGYTRKHGRIFFWVKIQALKIDGIFLDSNQFLVENFLFFGVARALELGQPQKSGANPRYTDVKTVVEGSGQGWHRHWPAFYAGPALVSEWAFSKF